MQLCFAVQSQLLKLPHPDNDRFHVMVCCGVVGNTFLQQFLVGTPQTHFPWILAKPTGNPASTFPNHPHPSKFLGTFPQALIKHYPKAI